MLIFKDITALVARLLTGSVLIAHGWQKFNEWTIAGTTQAFEGMGVPLPGLSAPLAAVIELVGGILILLGLGTRWVGVIVAALMAGAAIIAHVPNGIFVDAGGWELVGMIAAAGLALAASGAGRVSVDHLIASRRTPAA
ncbi:putative integral membrane protein [Corynebacterium renale]|uniref:DoxX family protein n=1 Tax=Corynebacterium renale TaxID=1724 RepID=UPI000DA28108|nr:DoxX family protein [Corynebacterium renale]SQG64341.1 putative integral membrane protein [Corynebacterium renale]STC94984.1 putative integral membrane protein [Corynebacterium renale]